MSLLGNLITQVARQALESNDVKPNPMNQGNNSRSSGGLGDLLGSVLGGSSAQANTSTQSNGFGLDDLLGSVLGGQRGGNVSGAGGLGSILGSVLGGGQSNARGGNTKAMLAAALLPIALNWIKRNGGVSGALNKIQDLGFGHQAQSWMSNQQQNQNLDPQQVNKLFDSEDIDHVCKQTGADETEVRQGLSELLPEIFNQLTPTGNLEKEEEANSEINEILSQISAALPK